jgi:SWI/SNF-related matrix-associated actin-dependent regulator 1 of chromatin subfamily A
LDKFKDRLLGVPFNFFVADESHYIKNQDAKRTKIAQELARKAKWKIFITGTPIYNKPKDLYVALNLIDPAMFDNFFSFATRYCGAKKVKFNNKSIVKYEGPTNVEELNTILRANYMVRRMKKDVLKDLPDKIKDVIILNESDLDVLVQKEKKAVEESKQNEERLKAEAEELKALAVKDKEFENLYKDKVKTLREIKFKNFGELSRIRKEIAIKKIPYVIEFVKEILDSSEDEQSKIVVFGHHKEVLYKIYEELKKYNPVIITGEVSDGERQRAIMLFKEKNPTRVFIGSMGAAGTGVDGLQQNCNTIVFAELDWTPALVDQAESRLQRIGQKNTVWVYHIVANESIDSRIVKLMMEKEAVSKEILDYRPEQIYDAVVNGK